MDKNRKTNSPTRQNSFSRNRTLIPIRLFILAGLGFMSLFLWSYAQRSNVGYWPLFCLLSISLAFKLLTMLHEWYHYWSIRRTEPPPKTREWTVDVFTTFCAGEPYEMIVTTLKAIQAIQYPHTAYLCDEANDPYLKQVCEELGVRHITRTQKINAKAGNINNALRQSEGEICLVLDPDHIPRADFFEHVLPHFENAKVGFVQVVQAYYNRKESFVAYGAAEQTYHFYGPMMMTMGQYGTAQAIGANCTFRRTALESIGGHAAGLSEDMHTAMQMHAKGWESVYVPEPLSRGLVPGTLSAYYKQQIKWARGTFELLFATYPSLFRKFTWRQRIHYFTLPLYYLFGLIGLIDILIPVLSLWTMQLPLHMGLITFVVSFAPLFFMSLLIRQQAQGWLIEKHEAGFHIIGGILRSGTWWIYLMGLIYTIFRVKVPYIPTPKNDQPKNNFWLCLPNILVCLLTLLSIGYGVHTYGQLIFKNPYYLIMVGFATINMLIIGISVIIGQEKFLLDTYLWIKQISFYGSFIKPFRLLVWRTRYRFYSIIRSRSMLMFGMVIVSLLAYSVQAFLLSRPQAEAPSLKKASTRPFYLGIDLAHSDGQPDNPLIGQAENRMSGGFSILPMHQTWEIEQTQPFNGEQLRAIERRRAIPLIYWEPVSSHRPELNQGIIRAIAKGKYDAYLERCAGYIRKYGKPVLITFAPEPDNPIHAWSTKGGNTMVEHQEAWRHVVSYFERQGVKNAVWVWNPWKQYALESYYPGSKYVDWIGISCLNYGQLSSDGEWHSFKALYKPYWLKILTHKDDSIRTKPVMLIKFGSTSYGGDAVKWVQDALENIKSSHPEIRSLVFYWNRQDTNWQSVKRPVVTVHSIDWTFQDPALPDLLLSNPPKSFKKTISKSFGD